MYPFLRRIQEAKARVGCASPPPDVLMKVLSGSVTVSLSLPTLPCATETLIFKNELVLNNLSLSHYFFHYFLD